MRRGSSRAAVGHRQAPKVLIVKFESLHPEPAFHEASPPCWPPPLPRPSPRLPGPPRLQPPLPSPIWPGGQELDPGLRRLPHRRRLARHPRPIRSCRPDSEYLVKQPQDFKSGKRDNAIMKGMAAALSRVRHESVAAPSTRPRGQAAGFAKRKDLVALGERIYRGGVADRQIPACAAATRPMVPVSRCSTRACRASTPSTPRPSSSRSATACARTARRWRARRGQDERPRDQGRRRLHRRPG